ncbi:MAG: hypothetical protein JKY02_06445 [Flavobacteriaceae bacterium]|nr:hypothetical protein [Flavobacteriaceae bacterium]
MDGWGALAMLIKRQEADKFRKAQLRSKLKKQKEAYLHAYESKDEFDFPKISSVEMKILKDQIRKDFRKEKIKNSLYFITSIVLVSSLIIYLYMQME